MELDFKWFLGILGIAIGAILSKVFDRWFAKEQATQDEILKLTMAIQALQLEIRYLTEKLAPMPKVQTDLNELHSKVRLLHAKLGKDEHRG